MKYSIAELVDVLRDTLSEHRFSHSLGVAECAGELAFRFQCDVDKAYLAGLLHDCAKNRCGEEMLRIADEAGIRVSEAEAARPVSLLHARLGAFIARRDYGVEDGEVLHAIARHQWGDENMTALDKIVGLADGIEPMRQGQEVERIRKLAETDLDAAYLEKHIFYMMNALRNGHYLPERKVKTYNWLLEEKKRKAGM